MTAPLLSSLPMPEPMLSTLQMPETQLSSLPMPELLLSSLPMPALWQWLLACLACVLAGLLVHAGLVLAARTWPALRGQRLVWLAAQGVVAAIAVLPFLPVREQLAVAPALTLRIAAPMVLSPPLPLPLPVPVPLPSPSPSPSPLPSANFGASIGPADGLASASAHTHQITNAAAAAATATETATTTATATATAGSLTTAADNAATPTAAEAEAATTVLARAPLLVYAPLLWALIYLAGLAYAVLRLARAWRLLRGLLARSRHLSRQALEAHGGFEQHQLDDLCRHRLTVMETDAAVSPMLVGVWHPVLLLPRHLRDFSVIEQRLIIAHELQHRRACDPLVLALSALAQTLLWFNPAPRWLGSRLAWAVELACDRRVLAGRPPQQRKQYAGALLAQWRVQLMTAPATALAFGAADVHTVGERIEQVRHATVPALPVAGVWTVAAVLSVVLVGGAVLQPALAVDGRIAPALALAPTAAAATVPPATQPIAWHNPLDKMRVAGFFGVMRSVSPRPSQGLDLAAPVGTPVHAAAAGTVLAAGELNENNGRYGTTVIIASADGHGTTEALYAHLASTAVRPGSTVVAGQVIGSVGVTGFTTGPHLHFQLRQEGRAIDPATVLAGLDQHATRRALTVRRQQLGY